jgi:hypothetical protein
VGGGVGVGRDGWRKGGLSEMWGKGGGRTGEMKGRGLETKYGEEREREEEREGE